MPTSGLLVHMAMVHSVLAKKIVKVFVANFLVYKFDDRYIPDVDW